MKITIFVVAGMYPAEDLRILPYNRVIKDLNGLTEDEFFTRIQENFILSELMRRRRKPRRALYVYGGKWYKLHFNVNYIRQPDPIERLDVSILQTFYLNPCWGSATPGRISG